MTQLVRVAIRHYRQSENATSPLGVRALLEATRGSWAAEDGLAYQRRVRSDWAKR